MGIDIIEGRDFDDRDLETSAAPVLIVNQAMARRYWPGESAVGKRLVGGDSPPADGQWSTVAGVVRDMRREGLETAPILVGVHAQDAPKHGYDDSHVDGACGIDLGSAQ